MSCRLLDAEGMVHLTEHRYRPQTSDEVHTAFGFLARPEGFFIARLEEIY
jgi:hypothetical protein